MPTATLPSQFLYHATPISPHRAMTPEGFLLVHSVPIARTGWQTYGAAELGMDGDDVEVYRSPDEVFSSKTIASFEGKSVTSPHPPTFLDPRTDSLYAKGHVQNVRKGPLLDDGERALIADLLIKDATLITQIQSGMLDQVSCGYDCEWYPRDDGKTLEQRQIRGNHVAIVDKGRAGSNVRLLDAQPEEDFASVARRYHRRNAVEVVKENQQRTRPTADAGGTMNAEESKKLDTVISLLEKLVDNRSTRRTNDSAVYDEASTALRLLREDPDYREHERRAEEARKFEDDARAAGEKIAQRFLPTRAQDCRPSLVIRAADTEHDADWAASVNARGAELRNKKL